MTSIFGQTEAEQYIRERLISGDWWCLILGQGALDFSRVVEESYYDGEANADFELMVSGVSAPVAFAHKRRMDAGQLAALIVEREGGDPATLASVLKEKDILEVQMS